MRRQQRRDTLSRQLVNLKLAKKPEKKKAKPVCKACFGTGTQLIGIAGLRNWPGHGEFIPCKECGGNK